MICKECQSRGVKSSIHELGSMTTLMGVSRSWDEDGNERLHDPNVTTTHYRCSNGHEWEDKVGPSVTVQIPLRRL
jgi:hypothetical protein